MLITSSRFGETALTMVTMKGNSSKKVRLNTAEGSVFTSKSFIARTLQSKEWPNIKRQIAAAAARMAEY